MRNRSNVSPVPLPVEVGPDAIELEYLDGRRVRYRGAYQDRDRRVEATRGFEVHVLVVDPDETEGVMVYVNDYDTSDGILESSGVGRVLLEDGERATVYPGVSARRSGERITVVREPDLGGARVFVFVESPAEERAYRLSG